MMASYHDKSGKFCPPNRAHTKSDGGDQYRVVRQHRRIGPDGKEIRVKRGARGVAQVEGFLSRLDRTKARVEHTMGLIGTPLLSFGSIFGEWSNEAGVGSTFKLKKGSGKARDRSAKDDSGYGPLIKKDGDKTVVGSKKKKMVFGKVVSVG